MEIIIIESQVFQGGIWLTKLTTKHWHKLLFIFYFIFLRPAFLTFSGSFHLTFVDSDPTLSPSHLYSVKQSVSDALSCNFKVDLMGAE